MTINPVEWARRWLGRRWPRRPGGEGATVLDPGPAPDGATVDFVAFDHLDQLQRVPFADQQRFERALLRLATDASGRRFAIPGFCAACGSKSRFAFDCSGDEPPNWRESLSCRGCGLISRWRGAIEMFRRLGEPEPDAAGRIYLTERLTPLYQWFADRYEATVGSEFVAPDRSPGERCQIKGMNVRHEDVTALSFADGALSRVLSFDVLEHVPDYRRGLEEIFRVLEPGGRLLLSVPFVIEAAATLMRARVCDDGAIEHLAPPEYHDDPVNADGALCFYHFGWDLLSELTRIGFSQVRLHVYWDPARGYLGCGQSLITAARPV